MRTSMFGLAVICLYGSFACCGLDRLEHGMCHVSCCHPLDGPLKESDVF